MLPMFVNNNNNNWIRNSILRKTEQEEQQFVSIEQNMQVLARPRGIVEEWQICSCHTQHSHRVRSESLAVGFQSCLLHYSGVWCTVRCSSKQTKAIILKKKKYSGVSSRSIFATKQSKDALRTGLWHYLTKYFRQHSGGLLKIWLFQCYEVLCIHNTNAICIFPFLTLSQAQHQKTKADPAVVTAADNRLDPIIRKMKTFETGYQ